MIRNGLLLMGVCQTGTHGLSDELHIHFTHFCITRTANARRLAVHSSSSDIEALAKLSDSIEEGYFIMDKRRTLSPVQREVDVITSKSEGNLENIGLTDYEILTDTNPE